MAKSRMTRTPANAAAGGVEDYRYRTAKRKNNPPAAMASAAPVPVIAKVKYEYNPHLPPVLRFDQTGQADVLETRLSKSAEERASQLLAFSASRALTPAEREELARILAEAAHARVAAEPWLEWTGKREKKWFEVDPVALHIHERISAQAILKVAAREDVQRSLFADPQQAYHEAVQFYKHDIDWANRLILGDSLSVMSSLAKREDLAGKVQMIYIDPPYGIKFASNFQPEIGKRDVKEKEQDLTREPEMIRAYRDTWNLGAHSYLSYLRDRLVAARELLTDAGSIFVQISDENMHRVRQLLDEIFGPDNFMACINYQTMTPLESGHIENVFDYLLWYAKDHSQVKYRNLYAAKEFEGNAEFKFVDEGGYWREVTVDDTVAGKYAQSLADRVFKRSVLESSGFTRSCTFSFGFQGRGFDPRGGKSWRTNTNGMSRLDSASRLFILGTKLYFKMFNSDFGYTSLLNTWTDTVAGFSETKAYVVQTHPKIVQRCLLMTTDPGDLAQVTLFAGKNAPGVSPRAVSAKSLHYIATAVAA